MGHKLIIIIYYVDIRLFTYVIKYCKLNYDKIVIFYLYSYMVILDLHRYVYIIKSFYV